MNGHLRTILKYIQSNIYSVMGVKDLRERAGVTQAELARRAGTSQPTVAAYEAGRKSPTLRTLTRLAHSVGLEPAVSYVPRMTREDRRSLAFHELIAERLLEDPQSVLERARRTLRRMESAHPHAAPLLSEWDYLLQAPLPTLIGVMRDKSEHARALRHVTPFAGILTAPERAQVIRESNRDEGALG